MKEICYVLIGKRIGRFSLGRLVKKTTGTAASVEFDWDWVLKREEEKDDILGFWHTHLDGIEPSERDAKTMIAWTDCFGKTLLCIIQNSKQRCGYTPAGFVPAVGWFRLSKIYKFFQFVMVIGV